MKNTRFKYENLLKELKEKIDSGIFKPDEKIPSEPEISREYDLSRNTIRQAMKELEIVDYIYRIQGKGTFVASQKQKSKKIAVVLYDLDYSVHPFTGKMVKGIGETAAEKGYSIDIIATGTIDEMEHEIFNGSRYAGFILGSYKFPSRLIGKMIAENIPFVFAKNYLPGLKINAVLIDYKKAGKMALEHLVSLKHRKIALLNAGKIPISKDFSSGVTEAAMKAGITFKDENIFDIGFDVGKIDSLIDRLMKFTAVITFDDDIAVELVKKLHIKGKKVPEDISITGCNDMQSAHLFSPGITTVRIPVYKLGQQTCEQILNIIGGNVMEENIVLNPELIIRESTMINQS